MKATLPYYENYARQAMIISFLSLLERFPFEEITILEICEEAGISRRTFYLYYSSRYDVLDDYYSVLTREYEDRMPGGSEDDLMGQISWFFTFWHEHRKYLQLLYRRGLFHVLMSRFSNYLSGASLIRNDAYFPSYMAGGLWAVLFQWTSGGFREPVSQITEYVAGYQPAENSR
ncbi:MAG: TetR/AcrR family transcriptional regulator [Solobacterium sp.]|nr:TetR/AcrR family transcriptional regulator [Solobacterium sp.]